ncbi:MAG: DUF4245 domain-containing protein [Marmoricola sp.]
MSQPAPNPHTQRSVSGMVGSMIVLLVLIGGWLGFRSLTRDHDTTQYPTVDWQPVVKVGRSDKDLLLFAPPALPSGWQARTVTYNAGNFPHWHLGLLTGKGKYVGIEESFDPVADLASQFVDENAQRGKDVLIGGRRWQTWTDSGGDYAVALNVSTGDGHSDSVMVVGSAPDQEIRDFAATLTSNDPAAASPAPSPSAG